VISRIASFDVRSYKAMALTLLFAIGATYWLVQAGRWVFMSDALLFRGAAEALAVGTNPWGLSLNGWSFAAPPLEAWPFLPFVPLSAPVFMAAWLGACAISAIVIVRRLGLPPTWLLYPPLVLGVVLGNPAIVGMACLMSGFPLIGLVLRPQLLPAASRRAIFFFVCLSILAIALRPDLIQIVGQVIGRYGLESRVTTNFWPNPLAIPAAIGLVLLARRDRQAARWLLMPAIGPAMGWYGYAMVLPIRSTWLALACAIPIPGIGAAAITMYAYARAFGVIEAPSPEMPLTTIKSARSVE
jgi:hypothetical protein